MKKRTLKIISAALCLCLCMGLGAMALADNSAPVAENLEVMTYRNVSVGGKLSAMDPDGDELTFVVTTQPSKGSVELDAGGSFVYTPRDGKKGRDYFGFEAVDSQGNHSQEATVIIKIARQKTCIAYSDMDGSADEYAAAFLAESGVYVGACVGGKYVFGPDESVTRGEFLAMCMELCGRELLSGVKSTGFADDGDMDAWLKPYVSTAVIDGVISGDTETGAFGSEQPITQAEAAVMLNNILRPTDVSAAGLEDNGAVPAWAAQSVANLTACRVISGETSDSESLTRAQAARMLTAAAGLIK